MFKNMVQPARLLIKMYVQKTRGFLSDNWGKNTDTHTEYVILIAFTRQQRLRERTSMQCSKYIACLDKAFENGADRCSFYFSETYGRRSREKFTLLAFS